jgi:methionyl-tRNA formyltransferase
LRCFLIGTKNIAVRIFEELLNQGHDVLGVFSEDEENSMQIWKDELKHKSIKEIAKDNNIPVFEGNKINTQEMIKRLTKMNLDVIFSIQGSKILRETILNIPKLGCINLHTALLPKNRGCFPMAWAIINDEKFSGVTIHKMLPGIDDGPIIAQKKIPITEKETGETLYEKVMSSGFDLFKTTLPLITNSNYTLAPQNNEDSSYHPCTNFVKRGYPFGGQINPYWDIEKKDRFRRALTFSPFSGATSEPPACMENFDEANIRVMLGFDCDRPRDALIVSEKGAEMARKKLESIQTISKILSKLSLPRTFFLCGHWLQSMVYKYDRDVIKTALEPTNQLVEIADHSYSHNVVNYITNRPDKIPLTPKQVYDEFSKNSIIFEELLDIKNIEGFRTPLGHFNGLQGKFELLDNIVKAGMSYVSSDLRGKNESLFAPLKNNQGKLRQPYRYENGLLEIPSIGWQDVVFSQKEYIEKFEKLPKDLPQSYDGIINYYRNLFEDAKKITKNTKRDFFVGLCLHPYDCSFYYEDGNLFQDLHNIVEELGGSFCSYNDVKEHFNQNLQIIN